MHEHNPFDLSELLAGKTLSEFRDDAPKVDRSGRPAPKDVRVQLNSGVIVKCEVRYDGLDLDQTRRFLIIAELDWENYWPTTLIVGEHPVDTTLCFRVPGVDDVTQNAYAATLTVVSEKIIGD